MPSIKASQQLSKAAHLLSKGQFSKAIIIYESILREAPDNVNALNDAAIAYQKIHRYHITEDYLKRALSCNPSHQDAFYNLIELLLGLKRPIEAALAFDRYQQHIPASQQKAKLELRLWPRPFDASSVFNEDGSPNTRTLNEVGASWGNQKWSANLHFAKKMLEVARAIDQPILECGSGFTTLLLGYLAAQHDVEVWTLEHNAKWHAYVSSALQRAALDQVNICYAPLCDYGDFSWYDISDIDLPNAFGLIVCDGPPAQTRGGRSGLFPVMKDRFADDCTILLDDTQRSAETELAERWASSDDFSLQTIQHEAKQFAVLTRTDSPRPVAGHKAEHPVPQGSAYPPLAHTYCSHLKEHPADARIFIRAVNLLANEGLENDAKALFETYEANIPESPSKQALRQSLFDHHPSSRPAHLGPICIGACGSSGTNLFRRLLDTHSQIACGKELSVFDRPLVYKLSLHELRAIYLSGDFKRLDEGIPFPMELDDGGSYFGLRPGTHGDFYHTVAEVLNLFDEADTVADFIDRFLLRYAQRRGKAIWAEKTPNNIYCAAQFLDAYPEGRFIQVLRDGRDVCMSLNRRRNFSPSKAVSRWISAVEAGLRIADHDRVYTLRYENLVHDPESTLKSVLEWLGLSFEPSMLDFTAKNEISVHGYAEQPIHSDSAFRWKKEWSDLDSGARQFLDLSLHKHLIATGYEEDFAPRGDSLGNPTGELPQVTVSTPSRRNIISPPPIFVGGAGRSGTKLVRAILNAHPNIEISHELKITPDLAKSWHHAYKYRNHLSKYFDCNEEEIDDAFYNIIASFLRGIREQSSSKRIGEKTPNNALVFPHLNHLFPESPLIHIIRDGRDVVSSLLQQDWNNTSGTPTAISSNPEAAARYWVHIVQAGRQASNQSRVRDRYLELRYEELTSAPEAVMRRIIAHVGEPWDDGILKFYEKDDPIHPSVQRPISDVAVGKWKTALDAEAKRIVKHIAGDLLIELGYTESLDW